MTAGSDIRIADAVRLMDDLCAVVARACAVIRAIEAGAVAQHLKPDQSPVTAADEASEATILEGLSGLLPGLPVVAEELVARGGSPVLRDSFAMVDPLDGTKEFLAGSDEFTVNLALVSHGTPIAGIVAAPNKNLLWRGVVGHGAERLRLTADGVERPEPIRARRWPAKDAVAFTSRSHLDAATKAFIDRLAPIACRPSGSAIKFCYLAEGTADVYPRLSTVCEWDVAAGQALLTAAGGIVATPQGEPLAYGRADADFHVPRFIAWGDPEKASTIRL